MDNDKLSKKIVETAYDLYVKRGRLNGYDLQDWIEAEKIVKGQRSKDAQSKAKAIKTKPVAKKLKEKETITAAKTSKTKKSSIKKKI